MFDYYDEKSKINGLLRRIKKKVCPIAFLFMRRMVRKIKKNDSESLFIMGQSLAIYLDELSKEKKINLKKCEKCNKLKNHIIIDKIDRVKDVEKLIRNMEYN